MYQIKQTHKTIPIQDITGSEERERDGGIEGGDRERDRGIEGDIRIITWNPKEKPNKREKKERKIKSESPENKGPTKDSENNNNNN